MLYDTALSSLRGKFFCFVDIRISNKKQTRGGVGESESRLVRVSSTNMDIFAWVMEGKQLEVLSPLMLGIISTGSLNPVRILMASPDASIHSSLG